MNETQIYEIRVKGHLDDEWSEWLGGMSIMLEEDGASVLTGPVTDQAALHGLLLKIHNMGLPLISFRCIGSRLDESDSLVSVDPNFRLRKSKEMLR
jgi:hypothetical protein